MIMVKLESHITVVLEIVAGTFLMNFTVEPPNEGHFSACVCVCVCVCYVCERERERGIYLFLMHFTVEYPNKGHFGDKIQLFCPL